MSTALIGLIRLMRHVALPISASSSTAFQHYYGELYDGNFDKMADDMIQRSTFLNQILSVPENASRWTAVKKLYYGDFDRSFIGAIDRMLKHEQSRRREASKEDYANRC